MNTFFSVIIPVYNIKKYIENAVNSILKQTYKNWELILVDDGSTDGSEIICDKYVEQNSKIRVIHKKNGGQSDARNKGITAATGKYILFVDGDDYIADWTLEKMREVIEQGDCDVILSEGFYYVYENGKIISHRRFNKNAIQKISGREALKITCKINENWEVGGKCIKRKFWEANKFKFIYGRLAEDFQLIDRVIFYAEKVSMIPIFYYYYQRSDSTVHAINLKYLSDMLADFDDWKDFFENEELENELRTEMYGIHGRELWKGVMVYVYLAEGMEKKKREKIIERIREYVFYIKYDKSVRSRLIYCCVKVIGLKGTCYLLGRVKKFKLKAEERNKIIKRNRSQLVI